MRYYIRHGSYILAFLISSISATTINVPADYSTIQTALNVAEPGDTVLVQPGTYYENIIWPDVNGIRLIGSETADKVIIDGGGIDGVIAMVGGSTRIDSATEISYFTLTGGQNTGGGGLYLSTCSPKLTNLIITVNSASSDGGGIYLGNVLLIEAQPHLIWRNIDVIGNSSSGYKGGGIRIAYATLSMSHVNIVGNSGYSGGGLYCTGSDVYLSDFHIIDNTSSNTGGGVYGYGGSITLENGEIKNNVADWIGGISSEGSLDMAYVLVSDNLSRNYSQGSGIYKNSGSTHLSNVTLANNHGGSGLEIQTGTSPVHNIVNSIIWNNGIYLLQSNITISFSNIEGGKEGIGTYSPATVTWGEGNIDLNPIFCDTSTGDFTLAQNSPCLGSGLNGSHMGAYGQGCGSIDVAPAAPQNLVAATGDGQITLTWNQNTEDDFLRYRVYGGTAPNPTTPVDSTAGIADTVKTIVELTNGTTYYYRVTAVDISLNESNFSNEVSVTPEDLTPPAAPRNLTAAASNGEVFLTWDPNIEDDFLRYRIYGGTVASPTTAIDSTESALDTTKSIPGLNNGTTYYFRITALDATLHESNFSNEVSATPLVLAVENPLEMPTSFSLHPNYPNPFNLTSVLQYDLPKAGYVRISVWDIKGREITRLVDGHLDPGYHQVIWDGKDSRGQSVPTGIYIARLVTSQYTKSIKMLLLK